jgi:NhaA family Na+:H+ antiporter
MRTIRRFSPRIPLRLAASLGASLRRFFAVESASAWTLLAASTIALVLAQLPAGARLHRALAAPLPVLGLGCDALVGEGLMSFFFFVVGLELRREHLVGVLREARAAALPLAAALGGMAMPAVLYLHFSPEPAAKPGWGVGTATDIAFAAAGLALTHGRLPSAARTLLLAIAVLDDLGAIIVLALGYGEGFAAAPFLAAGLAATMMAALRPVRASTWGLFALLAIVVWVALLRAGVHPALSGVVVAFAWPVTSENAAERAVELTAVIDRVHAPVAFVVMPLFAFAHAGVRVLASGAPADPVASQVAAAVTVALVIGKPLGIVFGARVATLLRIAVLPRGLRWDHLGVVGMLGGIGFTMALLVAARAFGEGPLLDAAKRGVLLGSVLSLVGAALAARIVRSSQHADEERAV